MLKRNMYSVLKKWKKDASKNALCLIGARQVGKTAIVREFAKHEYHQLVELNFLADPDAKKIFDGSLRADEILFKLSAFVKKPLKPNETLILFDEIQERPNARTAIKFLVEDGRYDYIEEFLSRTLHL